MITPSFSMTATERILPKLSLVFTGASLDSRITLTRSGNTATRVNSSGLIEIVNADLPRFDFDPITLACKGLLIEESRINTVTDSAAIGTGTWYTPSASVVSNDTTSPDGTVTADKITATAASGYVFPAIDLLASAGGGTFTYSVFVKDIDATTFTLLIGAAATYFATFNLSTKTVTGGNSTGLIQDYGNGWLRVGVIATNVANAAYSELQVGRLNNGTSVYVWGAQLEAGSGMTTYIPTTSAAVTRNADVAVMTGTNFSAWWTAVTGAVAVKYIPASVAEIRPIIEFDDGTANESIALRGNTTNPELYIVDGGADQAQIDAGTIAANSTYTLAGAWNTNSCAAAINGNAAVTDNTATMPTVTQARLGSDGTNYLNGWLQTIRYWPQRITNAETQAFSK